MFLAAIDLLKENGIEIPFNIKLILDSEEEKSSKPLPKAVKEYRELLDADFLIINDSCFPIVLYGQKSPMFVIYFKYCIIVYIKVIGQCLHVLQLEIEKHVIP